MLRIGVISDTHGLLRPEAEKRLAGVAHIIHAGDIGRPEVIDRLRRIAPVIAIRGNVDHGSWADNYPDTETVRLGDHSIYILHDIHDLQFDPAACGISVIIRWQDDLRISDIEPKFVCSTYGKRDIRPDFDWNEPGARAVGY